MLSNGMVEACYQESTSPYQASVDVGGKLLTNHLKELVSYRQWNMMDETSIVNDVKEKCCFLSQDFERDLEICALFKM